jgi:hypothetical protein
MIARRIRGVLTAATLWGLGSSLAAVIFTPVFFFANPHPIGRLPQILADLLPMSFGFGAATGALFALLVVFGERHRTLSGLSEGRFRFWGLLAGAIPSAVFEIVLRLGLPHASAISAISPVLCNALTGAYVAPTMLRAARRTADLG